MARVVGGTSALGETRPSRVLLRQVAGLVSFLLVIGATQACAGGFQSQEQSVRGLGGAHSMEATGSGADFLWWNPAAIGGMDEIEIYVGVHGILADASVRDLEIGRAHV